MNIQEFRKRYPQYDDLNDQQLATAIHQKFYSDLPQEQVFATLGFVPKPVTPAEPFTMSPEEMVDPEAALVLGARPFAPAKPAPAPEKPEEPMGYDEALDDAVNYLQEGVPEAQVKRMFEGLEWEDISARARQRGMFVPKVLEEYAPEQVRERVKKYGELKGTPETDFAQDPAKWTAEAFTNVGKRTGANYRDVATSFLVQSGGIDPIDAALTLKENARRRSAAAPSLAIQEGMQEIGASETYGDAVSAMLKNPRATFTMVVDSVATSVPLVAPALVVAPAGVPAAAAAAFVGSAGLEYGSVMADVLQDKGVDLSDALSIDKALRDPKIMNEIKEKGAKRGLIVGGFDALTMGLAGRFLRPVNELIGAGKLSGNAAKRATIAAWGKELAVQTGGGAAGEFLAQKATGEDRPADVLLEALAGGVTAPLEAMSALRGAREIEEGRAPPAPKGPTRIEPTLGPVAPATPPITAPAAPVAPPITPELESAFAELTFDDEEAAAPAAPTPPAPPAAITPPAPPAPLVQPSAEPPAPPSPSQPPVATTVPETAPATTPESAPKEPEFVLQNRDRSGTASVQQMESIARAPDYSRAGFSRTADGAPIISMATVPENQLGRVDNVTTPRGRKIPVQYAVVEADDIITSNDISGRPNPVYGDQNTPGARAIAGNGRVTGLRESFNLGTSNKYVEEMTNDSDLHGVSPEVISKMNKPVLVRVMPNESLTKDIGDELNLSEKLELSPIEQAKNDLNRVDFETLQFDEDGEITNQSLAQFINAQPVEERAKLVDRNLPTKQARQRLENAIFARAYKDDDLIAMFAQTDDPEAKLVISALAQVAPQMAKLEGAGNLDIREIVSDAAKIIISGKRKGLKLIEIASQIDMTVDPDTRIIVSLFAQNPRSNKAAIEALRTAADVAYQESIKPEEGLFGVEPKRERREILEEARDTYEPTGKKDVEAAKGAGTAPRDAEGKAQPSPDGVPPEDQGIQVQQPTKSLGLDFDAPEQPRRTTKQEREAGGFRLMPGPAPERSGTNLDLFGTEGLSQLPPPSQLAKRKRENARQLGLFEDSPLPPNEDNSAGESARRDAVSTVDDLQSTDTILGLALTDDYAARQRASLVGQKINNYDDLAVLSQVYRHPRFETFRLFFTDKDGKIISQLGITSRLPGSASVIVGNDVDRYVDLVQTAAIGAGATGFWMLHNHPSGNTNFSNADLLLTKGYEEKFKNLTFNGHIVLDTNKFGVIDRGQNVLQINRDMGQKDLIESLGDYKQVFNVIDMAKKIDENPDSTVVVSVNSGSQVVGITTINNSDVIGKTPSQVTRYLQKLAISNMGGRIAVATRNKVALDAIASNVEDGLLINPDGSYKTFRDLYRGVSFLFPSFRPGVTTADTSKLFDFLRIPKSPVNTLKFNQADLRVLEPEQEDLDGTYEKKILKNLPDDVDDYMKKYDRPDTPYETSTPVKDAMLGSAQAASQAAKDAATNPLDTASKLIGSVDRGLTAVQNEFVWFGSGLDAADFSRYNGQLRDGYGRLAASAYATQAMHAGHVGTQVINLGRLIFNAKTQLFQAVKDQYSMANVVRLKAEIVKLLGEQRSANLINTYFEAKRARSIQNEYQRVEANYQNATTPEAKSDLWEELQQIIRAYDKIPSSFLKKDPNGDIAEVDVIGPNNKKISVAIVDDTAIDEAIDFEIQVPQLRDMMTNWTAVNQNMLENMRLAGILSKERYQKLKSIKDYVPWYRVMDDNMDIHEPTGGAVRGLSGVPRERTFGKGRTERAVDDIVDNMLHNVLLLTKSTMRNYANNRIIQNYAARDAKGRVKLAKREGPLPNGSVGVKALINGRRVTVEITDPLVAAASIGMENIDLPVNEILGTLTNAFRRGITLDPFFQLAQIIKDAPGAAWVTGVRNPLALIGGVFESFVMALNPNDPVTQTLKSYGIGGFQSLSRSPERQLKIDIGLLNKSNFARALDILDRIGDASDFAQRRAIYNRVLKETGDETQALLQANNIIDFMKRGSSRSAQFVSRYVAFANAYAQSINVLAQALAGGGLKGMSRKKAQARILKTGALLAGLSTLYAMSVAGSEEYEELDDQTRLRNIVIPGSKAIFGEAVLIPMNTSAAFLFKALPELTYNKIIRDGTETEMDATRLKKALAEAAADSLLGPNIVPSAIKPAIEVALNKNFWTGSTVIPRGLEKFESAEQYNAATSELAKTLSGLTEVGDKRLLSPIEFDHMIRGMFGTAGYLSMYASNMLAAERPDPRLRDTPGLGRFFAGPVGRKNEELFYDLKERAEKKYQTYQLLAEKRDKQDEAEKYLDKNIGLISAYEYIKDIESDFQDINDLIRQIGESSSYPGTPKEKREEITDLQKLKSDVLEGVERERKEAGL